MHPRHHGINASRVKVGKAYPACAEKLVTGMFGVVLVVGIIDNALKVAFVIAYFKSDGVRHEL